MRKCFPVLVALTLCSGIHAQVHELVLVKKDPAAFIFKRNHISFSLIVGVAQKAEIHPLSGSYHLGSRSGKALQAGFNYHINISKVYSLTVGLHGTGTERNYTAHIPQGDFSPPRSKDFDAGAGLSKNLDMYVKLPISFQRRWYYGRKKFIEASAGISICFYPDDILEVWYNSVDNGNGSSSKVLELVLEVTRDFKPWVDYNLGFNHAWILKHYNLLRIGIVCNYCPVSIAQGSYSITVPGKPLSTGNYLSHHSYLGISATYAFTDGHKAVRRIYEREGKKKLDEFIY